MREFVLISYANRKEPGYYNFVYSATIKGIPFKILGEGEKWVSFTESKIKACADYIKNLSPEIIVCVVDCFDLFPLCDKKEIITKYESYNKPIVFGAEIIPTSSTPKLWKSITQKRKITNRKWINGGLVIGTADALSGLFREVVQLTFSNDQDAYASVIEKYPDIAEIDDKCLLIGNITVLDHKKNFSVKNNRLYYGENDSYPCFVHFPGSDGDMYLRMDYYGKKLLGNAYRSVPWDDRLSKASNKIKLHIAQRSKFGMISCLVILILIIGLYYKTKIMFGISIIALSVICWYVY